MLSEISNSVLIQWNVGYTQSNGTVTIIFPTTFTSTQYKTIAIHIGGDCAVCVIHQVGVYFNTFSQINILAKNLGGTYGANWMIDTLSIGF